MTRDTTDRFSGLSRSSRLHRWLAATTLAATILAATPLAQAARPSVFLDITGTDNVGAWVSTYLSHDIARSASFRLSNSRNAADFVIYLSSVADTTVYGPDVSSSIAVAFVTSNGQFFAVNVLQCGVLAAPKCAANILTHFTTDALPSN